MNFYLTGGTEGFRKFVRGLCGPDDRLHQYDDPEKLPENDRDGVYFLLPRYEAGLHSIPELSFEKTEGFLETIRRGGRFYFENLTARDNCRRRLTGLQTMGNFRHLFKECILYDGMILQARKSYYFPGHNYMKPEKDFTSFESRQFRMSFRNFPCWKRRFADNGQHISGSVAWNQSSCGSAGCPHASGNWPCASKKLKKVRMQSFLNLKYGKITDATPSAKNTRIFLYPAFDLHNHRVRSYSYSTAMLTLSTCASQRKALNAKRIISSFLTV